MTVSLSCSMTDKVIKDFTRCLRALPNLHTLEITSIESLSVPSQLRAGLKSTTLPQIRTAILPSTAHHILRHCPNIEDLTCSPGGPDKEFIESLAVGKLNLRRFATLRNGEVGSWTSKCPVYMATSLVEVLSARTGTDLPSNQGIILHACKLSPYNLALPSLSDIYCKRDYALKSSKKCITALKSLSTIRLVNYVHGPTACACYPGLRQKAVEGWSRSGRAFVKIPKEEWEEMKKVAREHLEGCGSSGPKTLRTVTVTYCELIGVEYLEPEEEFSI